MEGEERKPVWAYWMGGVAVGAVLGVLFARKPGRELRADLKALLRRGREKSQRWLELARDRIPAKRDQVLAAIRAGKEAYRGGNHNHHHRKELTHS